MINASKQLHFKNNAHYLTDTHNTMFQWTYFNALVSANDHTEGSDVLFPWNEHVTHAYPAQLAGSY